MAAKRSHVIALMRGAFKRGQSSSSFIWDMKQRGLSYRRTDMLSDWRSESNLKAKEGLMQYVRRDYYPSEKVMAAQRYDISKEYMYVVKVQTRLRPDAPVIKRKVNILSDVPMTPRMVEQAVIEKWSEWENYTAETLEEIQAWTGVHRME